MTDQPAAPAEGLDAPRDRLERMYETERRALAAPAEGLTPKDRQTSPNFGAPAEGLREALERCIDAMDIVRDGLAVKSTDAVVINAESILRPAAKEARAALDGEQEASE